VIYGIICRAFIRAGQLGKKYSYAIGLALISYIVLGFTNLQSNVPLPALIVILSVLIILFSFSMFSISKLNSWLIRSYIKYRFDLSIVGVLDGSINPNDIGWHVPKLNFFPSVWVTKLEELGLRVERIAASDICGKYCMVINPFGGSYIEEDIANLITLKRIKRYIKNGGVFVNTKDLAFWRSWNSLDRKQGITSPGVKNFIVDTGKQKIDKYIQKNTKLPLQPIISGHSIIDTWLYDNYGVRTTSFRGTNPGVTAVPHAVFLNHLGPRIITEFRAACNCDRDDTIFYRLISTEIIKNEECYPVAAVHQDIGYLILFGTAITNVQEFEYECEIIKEIYRKFERYREL
jgi:hypothetical protein